MEHEDTTTATDPKEEPAQDPSATADQQDPSQTSSGNTATENAGISQPQEPLSETDAETDLHEEETLSDQAESAGH